jgi:hypothetical protein
VETVLLVCLSLAASSSSGTNKVGERLPPQARDQSTNHLAFCAYCLIPVLVTTFKARHVRHMGKFYGYGWNLLHGVQLLARPLYICEAERIRNVNNVVVFLQYASSLQSLRLCNKQSSAYTHPGFKTTPHISTHSITAQVCKMNLFFAIGLLGPFWCLQRDRSHSFRSLSSVNLKPHNPATSLLGQVKAPTMSMRQ